ncbi:helix-turn-helix transcriptional regulator [Coprobacillaceae bacterium CR2/5/TPMF4]|nr:helix-turn-helix transcriptional regulator [Coprobacillaceae bacterium CR2/5/TPMF4]
MNTEYFKELLVKNNMSRYKFCKITGISSGALTDLLNKKVKFPRIDTLIKIAKALNLNDHEFAKLCEYIDDKKIIKGEKYES